MLVDAFFFCFNWLNALFVTHFAHVCFMLIISLFLFQTKIMYSLFTVILAFIAIAIILFLTGMEFLAMLLLIVYIGAILIFFLFAIMLIDLREDEFREGRRILLFNIFFILFVYFVFFFPNRTFVSIFPQKNFLSSEWTDQTLPLQQTVRIPMHVNTFFYNLPETMYVQYQMYPLLIAFILFCGLLYIVILCYELPLSYTKTQALYAQVLQTQTNAIRPFPLGID